MRVTRFSALVFSALVASVHAELPLPAVPSFSMPPIATDLKGVVERPEVPPIAWALRTKPVGAASELAFTAETSGAAVRLEALLDTQARHGTWRLVRADLDLNRWFEVLQAIRPVLPRGTHASGALQMAGKGQVREGRLSGQFSATITNGSLTNAEQKWSATGIQAKIDLPHLPSLSAEVPHVYTFKEALVSGLVFRDGEVAVRSQDPSTIQVLKARIKGLGGELTFDPFELDVQRPETTVRARMRIVQLKQLRPFFPAIVTDVAGTVDGDLTAAWGPAGLGACEVRLRPSQSEKAIMRIYSAEPLFSHRVPERVELLPARLGPLDLSWLRRRILVGKVPLSKSLRQIETGSMPLLVDAIQLKYTPESAGRGPHVFVEVLAKTENAKESKVGGLRFTVNVDAPLTDLIHMALNEGWNLGSLSLE